MLEKYQQSVDVSLMVTSTSFTPHYIFLLSLYSYTYLLRYLFRIYKSSTSELALWCNDLLSVNF
uniref:Uncharacterized protein n=1 Tax=Arundo donax TaxID=35708 RepID=A0A0A9A713_ARUDO